MAGMRGRVRFPIRFKFLVILVFVVTVVVSLITFTMAKLFHTDKTAYIHDLTSLIALHTAQEARSELMSYERRMRVLARLMHDEDLTREHKADLLKRLFEDFQEFVAISFYLGSDEPVTVYDSEVLETNGLRREDLLRFRDEHPLPTDRILAGEVYIENSTMTKKLPTLTMAIPYELVQENKKAMLVAVIRLENLLELAGRSKVFETFLVNDKGALLAHADQDQVTSHLVITDLPDLKILHEGQSLGTSTEYLQGDREMVGGFAPVDLGGLIVGVQIPKTAAYLTARQLLNNLIAVSLLLLVASAIVSLFWSRRITRSIEQLSNATHVVAKGRYDIQVEATSNDEIGELAGSFNQMASELKTREETLKETQSALVQSEKMAAFGQLGAGIAHEVKNPLAGILGYAQLAMRKLAADHPLRKNLEVIEKETKRCKTIIENLMKFARQEESIQEPIQINRVVEDAITIVDHQLGINEVRLEKELGADLPSIQGNGNQLQQVLMNLLINGQQAMDGKPGTIRIITKRVNSSVQVRVSDTGPGVPKEIQSKLFEPFFTTKPAGKGTGLGLSVTYGIIKDHRGEIGVESGEGEGATFVITLPVIKNG